MKRLIIICFSVLSLCSCSILSGINWNPEGLASAAGKTITAASISDEQIVELSRQTVLSLDKQNTIIGGEYQNRLQRLLKGVDQINGLPVNYKVYKTDEINAFACGDGSIRVYSGLMDVMNDQELIAIIGHELGHVKHQDTKKALKNAYIASAARDVVGSAGSYGALISSLLGDMGEALVSSQFSQAQEYKADEHGFEFAIERGYGPRSMENALNKLLTLSGSSSNSIVAHMFASHPQTEKRIEKMKKAAESYETKSSK
ncbi:MAG: M48 family metalloprotease [Bacteroidales bacterium]|nr:M48 family metalloprotease [Bacteroidales bacterium]